MCSNELINALTNDDLAELEQCLKSSASFKIECRNSLHYAASFGSAGAIRLLLEAKAEVNWADILGLTPLHKAAHSRSVEAVQLLLKVRAQVDRLDKSRMTALHLAASSGSVEVLRMLLAARADVNLANRLGETPLHKVARSGNHELAQLLVEARADLDQTTVKNKMAVDIAQEACHHEVARVLERANRSDRLWDVILWDCIDLINGTVNVTGVLQSINRQPSQPVPQLLHALPSEVGTAASSSAECNPQSTCYSDSDSDSDKHSERLEGSDQLEKGEVDAAAYRYTQQAGFFLVSVPRLLLDATMRYLAPLAEVDLPMAAIL